MNDPAVIVFVTVFGGLILVVVAIIVATVIRNNRKSKAADYDYREEMKRLEEQQKRAQERKLTDFYNAENDPTLVVATVEDVEQLAAIVEPVRRGRGRPRKSQTTH